MGTWDTGPFDNDTAADFADALDEAPLAEREPLVRAALRKVDVPVDLLCADDAQRAVAAAALVVAQHPAGPPACPGHGPSEPLPEFPAALRALAIDALDHVVADSSELAESWVDSAAEASWRRSVRGLRDVLDPPLPPQEEVLFHL
ncbi:DUF4259 domain-containing protein [Streptomyces sp. NPDC048659]|uniref:DUF4259 domain-containing protein n=1 Tax=Streptomyces sp. NPDC048659 TaxID=3155489 RepID=UPI00343DCDD0